MLPSDIRTTTVHVGPFLDDLGEPWSGTVTVESSIARVWDASAAVISPRPAVVALGDDGTAAIPLATTDQPGFSDGAGRPVSGWTYTLTVELAGGGTGPPDVRPADEHRPRPPPDARAGRATRRSGPHASRRPPRRRRGPRRRLRGTVAAQPAAAGPSPARRRRPPHRQNRVRRRPPGRHHRQPEHPPGEVVTGGRDRRWPRELRLHRADRAWRRTSRTSAATGSRIRVQLKDAARQGHAHVPGALAARRTTRTGTSPGCPTHPTYPVTIAWIGAHFLNNDDPSLLREQPQARAHQLRGPRLQAATCSTRLEIKIVDTADRQDRHRPVGRADQHGRLRAPGRHGSTSSCGSSATTPTPRTSRSASEARCRSSRGGCCAHAEGDEPRAPAATGPTPGYVDSPLRGQPRVTGGSRWAATTGTAAGLLVRRNGAAAAVIVETPWPPGRAGRARPVRGGRPVGHGRCRPTWSGTPSAGSSCLVDGTHCSGATARPSATRSAVPAGGRTRSAPTAGCSCAAAATPATASDGGVLFVDDGALRFRGAAGR